MFEWIQRLSKKTSRSVAMAPRPSQSTPPAVTLRWLLGLSGVLADGSNESIRFRENVESQNIRLNELEEWTGEALETPHDEQRLFALQDIVNSLGTRLGFQVEYGAYEAVNADWMPFDGLWRLREDLYLAVEVFSDPLERVDFSRLEKDLAALARNPAIGKADTVACFVLAAGADPTIEDQIRTSRLHDRIRLLPLTTLFDLLRMDAEGVLARDQLPVLLRPFSSTGVHTLLHFLEAFIGAYQGAPAGAVPSDPEAPVAVAVAPAIAAAPPPPPPPVPPMVSFDRALELYRSGNREEAQEGLRDYLKDQPQDAEAWETAADWARDDGDLDTAERAYQAALSRDGSRMGPVLALAGIYRERGDIEGGLTLLNDAAGDRDEPAPVLVERARLLLALKRGSEAANAAQTAHALGGGNEALRLLARARRSLDDLEGAEAALITALETDESDAEARELLEALAEERRLVEPLQKTGS
jgi:Tfp pilus assembly protein PilF